MINPLRAGVPANPGDDITHEVRFTVKFLEGDLVREMVGDYDLFSLRDGSVYSEPGKPVMPEKSLSVAIPAGTEVVRVEARPLETIDIPGLYRVMPGQPPRRTSEKFSGLTIGPDEVIYGSRRMFPGELVVLDNQSDLAGQQIAHIRLYPLRYVPAERRLVLHEMVEVVVSCRVMANSASPAGESYDRFTDFQRRTYEEMLKSMVMNPDDVELSPPPGERSSRLPSGEYDHVIITTLEYAEAFIPLVDWHTKKGVRDTVVTPGWIYRNYEGPGDTLKIRQFVMDASSHWGTMYFLMGGEHSSVPFVYRLYQSEECPSDQYYSDYDGDWTHEVFVGRAPVESVDEVTIFVDKVLKYEKDPPRTDYPVNVLLLGFDLDSSTPCENLKEVIDGYLPDYFNVTKVYDSDTGNHYHDANDALEAGQNLVNHADHCGSTVMGVGSVNHGWLLSNWDVAFLNNDDRTSILVSMGCWPNAMDQNDCIAEHFVIYNPGQAGVAYNGNTRSGWYYIGNTEGLSCQLDRDWWRGIFQYGQNNLGKAITWDKHHFPQGGWDMGLKRHCEWTFNLLGEPEMPIWLNTPVDLDVSCADHLPIGNQELVVEVWSSGEPLEGARICVMKKGEVYKVALTDTSGLATLPVHPSTHGRMDVTVTAADHIPFEGTCRIVPPHEEVPLEMD